MGAWFSAEAPPAQPAPAPPVEFVDVCGVKIPKPPECRDPKTCSAGRWLSNSIFAVVGERTADGTYEGDRVKWDALVDLKPCEHAMSHLFMCRARSCVFHGNETAARAALFEAYCIQSTRELKWSWDLAEGHLRMADRIKSMIELMPRAPPA